MIPDAGRAVAAHDPASVDARAIPAWTPAIRRSLWAVVAGGTLLSAVVSYRTAMRAFVLGSPAAGWVYQYLYGFQPHTLAIVAVVTACCSVMAVVSAAAVRRREWIAVVMWLAIGVVSQAVIRQLTPFGLEDMFVSDGSNGFYTAAQQHAPGELMRDFDRLRHTFPAGHAQFNMPGKVLLTYALSLVTDRPAVQAWLVVVLSNLGGLFLYVFVRDFLHDRTTAIVALVFYLFVPAKLLFFPVMNTVTPVVVLACGWCWLRLLRSHQIGYAAALGALAYASVFFDPTASVMGLLFVVLTAHAVWRGELSWRSAAALTAATVFAFSVTYLLVFAVWRFDLLTALRGVGADAVAFNTQVSRPYGPWVGRNLLDFAWAAGVCQAILFCWMAARSVTRSALRADGAAGRIAAFSVGTVVVLLVTDLLGINRGEIVRLWIFLACFVQVPAAYACARLESRAALVLVISTTLLQTALSTSMMAFAQP